MSQLSLAINPYAPTYRNLVAQAKDLGLLHYHRVKKQDKFGKWRWRKGPRLTIEELSNAIDWERSQRSPIFY